MKKTISFAIVGVMSLAASVAAFANSSASENDSCYHDNIHIESAAQGNGACSVPSCRCGSFNQRPGYYQCWCGHQRFSHR